MARLPFAAMLSLFAHMEPVEPLPMLSRRRRFAVAFADAQDRLREAYPEVIEPVRAEPRFTRQQRLALERAGAKDRKRSGA